MVKIEDVTVESLHRKLKIRKVEKLAREFFGPLAITEVANSLYIEEKPKYIPENLFKAMSGLGIIISNQFLVIHLYGEEFNVKDKEYFDKTMEFARQYSTNFGGKGITLITDYSK